MKSVKNALTYLGFENVTTFDPKEISKSDGLILPGVGSFKKSMEVLVNNGWSQEIAKFIKKGNFLFGICLGMQLLFKEGYEDGFSEGLGLIDGQVKKIKISQNQVLPHVGWNNLTNMKEDDLIFKNIRKNADY